MTEQVDPKKKAGSIRQYATLGKSKTPEHPGTQTPKPQSTQTSERQDSQEPARPEPRTPKRQDSQTLERSSAQEPKRKRHTIYLSPALSKWLKHYATDAEQEISEI